MMVYDMKVKGSTHRFVIYMGDHYPELLKKHIKKAAAIVADKYEARPEDVEIYEGANKKPINVFA
jgi:adenosine/AMP kinase